MDYLKLKNLGKKIFFTPEDISFIFNIRYSSAKVLCARYEKKGIFLRLKKNFYVLAEKLENMNTEDFFILANFLQVPSYISLSTALSYYGVSTQVQKGVIESICLTRTKSISKGGVNFKFYKIKKDFYNSFLKSDGFFIAEKEKAFIDALYFISLGRYSLDFSALDFDKLDYRKIKKIIKQYPDYTKKLLNKLCGI